MRKAFLKKARETLEGMRSQLLRQVEHDISRVRDQNKDEGMDTYDLASDARDLESATPRRPGTTDHVREARSPSMRVSSTTSTSRRAAPGSGERAMNSAAP